MIRCASIGLPHTVDTAHAPVDMVGFGKEAIPMTPSRTLSMLLALAALSFAGETKSFDVKHELTVPVPDGAKQVRVWFTQPQADPLQQVTDFKVESAVPHKVVKDSEGNTYLYFELANPSVKEFRVTNTFHLTRQEVNVATDPAKTRPYAPEDLKGMEKYLRPHANVVMDDRMKTLSREIVGDEKNPIQASRKIYDWVLQNIDYWVKDPANKKASPVGSAEYCLTSKTGNCTDFHSLYMSLSRCAGIPTRITYGSFLKGPLAGADKDQSYHCWLEFFAPGVGWVPLDVAVADLFVDDFEVNDQNEEKVSLTLADGYDGPSQDMIDYYFGNLDARRVTWSMGRDLDLEPKQAGGPVNAMAKAHVEVDGKAGAYDRKLTYTEAE